MDVSFDFEKMKSLLESFYNVTGIRYSLFDNEKREILGSCPHTSFCHAITSVPEGLARCNRCDRDAIDRVQKTYNSYTYRCHAGLLETIIPIMFQSQPVGYIIFGQFLDESDKASQWNNTSRCISWFKPKDKLFKGFYELKCMDEKKRQSCIDLINACSDYIRFEAVYRAGRDCDFEMIGSYIKENFSKSPTLDIIASDLHVSKTKLCKIAADQGTTVKKMLHDRQLKNAGDLLKSTDFSINEIASMVGIDDYNYFSRFFKSHYGISPSEFRRLGE